MIPIPSMDNRVVDFCDLSAYLRLSMLYASMLDPLVLTELLKLV